MSIQKSRGPDRKTCYKPNKFELKIKVQGRILIMNISDTLFHGDTSMCQIWQAIVNPKKKSWAGHENVSNTLFT